MSLDRMIRLSLREGDLDTLKKVNQYLTAFIANMERSRVDDGTDLRDDRDDRTVRRRPPIRDEQGYEDIIPPVYKRPETINHIITKGQNNPTIKDLVKQHYNPGAREPFTIGIKGDFSKDEIIKICNGYSSYDAIYYPPIVGKQGIKLRFVGMTPDAAIRGLELGQGNEEFGTIESVECYDLGIKAPVDGARQAVKNYGHVGTLVLDNCHFLPTQWQVENSYYEGLKWGMHLKDISNLLVKDCKRGVFNGAKVRYSEHWAYLLGTGNVYFLNNDIAGGNRTGFQIRTPKTYYSTTFERPYGDYLIDGNYADGYGMDWDNHNGGSCITIWGNPDYRTIIRNNNITNARYGCITVTRQPDGFFDREGYSHKQVILDSNTFSQHPNRGQKPGNDHRPPASFSDTKDLRFYGDWDITPTNVDANLVLNSKTSVESYGANMNKKTFFENRFPEAYKAYGMVDGNYTTIAREVLDSYWKG